MILCKSELQKFYFRYSHNELPQYFTNICATQPVVHPYVKRFRDVPRQAIPVRNTTKKSIRFYAPDVVNKMPPCIINKIYTHSYDGFSRYIKLFFCNQYSEICITQNCYVCNNWSIWFVTVFNWHDVFTCVCIFYILSFDIVLLWCTFSLNYS